MMQKRKLSSLLLISFIVVFSFSFAAANEVDFGSSDQLRCDGALQAISITASQDIVGFEIIAVITGDYTGMPSVSFTPAVPGSWTTYIAYSGDGTAPDTIRLAAIRLDAGDPALAAGTYDVATLSITTDSVCQGAISIIDGDWIHEPNPTGPITTQFIDGDGIIYAASIIDGAITIVNDAPLLAAIADGALTWNAPGNVFNTTAVGSDDDLGNSCEELTYSLDTKPDGMTIDAATGEIDWTADGDDVCNHAVTVRVTDNCGSAATTSFNICVSNETPTVADLDPILIGAGTVAAGQFAGSDPDGGPTDLLYEIASFDGPGSVTLDAATGEFSWNASVGEELETSYTLCVSVSDQTPLCGCNENNADTACVTIEVVPLRYVIEKAHGIIQGGFTEIDVMMPNDGWLNYPIGGFEFLIEYDASALSFLGAEAGSFIDNCEWEYFTYRTGPFGNCGSACPSGMIKIVGLAETNNGAGNHPVAGCSNTQGNEQIARLKFYVSNDRNLECQYVPIRFVWLDCADNSVSDEAGTHLFWGDRVFAYDGPADPGNYFMFEYYTELVVPDGVSDVFPSIYGPTAECDEIDDAKADIFSYIDFFNGGIDIVCADSIDARGDINLDGIAYTVADAVMYTNYFVQGMSALVYIDSVNQYGIVPGYAGSVAASDVNADGLTLTVADLVTLIRVVVGDEQPIPKPVSVEANITYTNNNEISVGEVEMGAAYVVVSGEATPRLLADGMDIMSQFDGQNTRILVYSLDGNSFSGEFLAADGDVVSIEMATADASPVVHKLIPADFGLAQNYPNPFNPSTTINFNMPQAGDYALTIYNVTGQIVAEFNGSGEAGVGEVVWEASSNASGVYFYKLSMNGFSATKKMVLLK